MTTLKSRNEPRNYKNAGLNDLTPRELEILQLVLTGKTNKGIAGEICISAKTVEFHLENIYKKLGVQTRMMAAIWAMKQGLYAKAGGIAAFRSE